VKTLSTSLSLRTTQEVFLPMCRGKSEPALAGTDNRLIHVSVPAGRISMPAGDMCVPADDKTDIV